MGKAKRKSNDEYQHAERDPKTSYQERRRAILTHETQEKKDAMKLQLHLKRVKKNLEVLKEKLEQWDPERKKDTAKEDEVPKKRVKYNDPSTWKLRGAARPAWEVYDFDTRYEDPHAKAHDEDKARIQRSLNILAIYRGKIAETDIPEVREYLGLLMEQGHLAEEAKQYKTARSAWLECMELEGDVEVPLTSARESLMRMFVNLKRFDSVLRLAERLSSDRSVWIRYSAALIAVEQNSESKNDFLESAIRCNPLCAYYLSFHETFSSVFEYTDEVEQSDDLPETALEEAIEYCNSEHASMWAKTGATKHLRSILLGAKQGQYDSLSREDVDVEPILKKIEGVTAVRSTISQSKEIASEPSLDLSMFIGMFRTAMEMLSESGEFD